MNLMICMRGNPEQLEFLPEIGDLGAGIELGSYGMIGIQSQKDWEERIELHRALRARFQGTIAIHGPFIGMEYAHVDHLIRDAVRHRLDMTFAVATELDASRVILHSGYRMEYDLFSLRELWLEQNIEFWRQEIPRWVDRGVSVAIENNTESRPDLLISLVSEVDDPFLGLCFDIGHQNIFSDLDAVEWINRMSSRLMHIHLHDNDGVNDRHLPVGKGTIDFEPFFEILQSKPDATISLEVEADMESKMADLRRLAARFMSV